MAQQWFWLDEPADYISSPYHVSITVIVREHNTGGAVDGLAGQRFGQVMLVPDGVLAVAVARESCRQHLALVAEERAFGRLRPLMAGPFLRGI